MIEMELKDLLENLKDCARATELFVNIEIVKLIKNPQLLPKRKLRMLLNESTRLPGLGEVTQRFNHILYMLDCEGLSYDGPLFFEDDL